MLKLKGLILVLFSVLILQIGYGQLAKNVSLAPDVSAEVNFYGGSVLDIHPFFPETNNPFSVEAVALFKTHGRRYWQQAYNFPGVTAALSYTDFGNKLVLGQSLALKLGLNIERHLTDKLHFQFRPAAGIAVHNNPYDALSNRENLVIGSKLTAHVSAELGLNYQLSNQLSIRGAGAFWHFSNGHFSVPNIGANNAYYSVGLNYRISKETISDKPFESKNLEEKWLPHLELGLGVHEVEGTVQPIDGPKYPVYSGSLYVSKRKSYRAKYLFGVTYSYYTDVADFIVSQEIFEDKERLKATKLVAFIGQEWMFGRLAWTLQIGYNLYYPFREQLIELGYVKKTFIHSHLSNKVGFKYYFLADDHSTRHNPFIGIGVRALGGRADFVEMSLGFPF